MNRRTQTQFEKHKTVFLGDQSVGKTSIISRFMYDCFDTNYQPTIGIDLMAKSVCVENKSIRFQIWDTAGQERFSSLIPGYIRDSSVAIIVYDITNKTSFESVHKWVDNVKIERGEDVVICLVGNKIDLKNERVVSYEEGEIRAKNFGALFLETSAKEGQSVRTLFCKIAAYLPPSESLEDEPLKLLMDIPKSDQTTSVWDCKYC